MLDLYLLSGNLIVFIVFFVTLYFVVKLSILHALKQFHNQKKE